MQLAAASMFFCSVPQTARGNLIRHFWDGFRSELMFLCQTGSVVMLQNMHVLQEMCMSVLCCMMGTKKC